MGSCSVKHSQAKLWNSYSIQAVSVAGTMEIFYILPMADCLITQKVHKSIFPDARPTFEHIKPSVHTPRRDNSLKITDKSFTGISTGKIMSFHLSINPVSVWKFQWLLIIYSIQNNEILFKSKTVLSTTKVKRTIQIKKNHKPPFLSAVFGFVHADRKKRFHLQRNPTPKGSLVPKHREERTPL